MGRDLRKPPVQPPALSRIICEIRSGLYPGLENLQGWRLHSLSGQPLLDRPGGEKVSPYTQSEPLLFQLMPVDT